MLEMMSLPQRTGVWLRPFVLVLVLWSSRLPAFAGHYVQTSQTGGVMTQNGTTTQYAYGFGGYGASYNSDFGGNVSFSGTITAVFTWQPDSPTDLPPANVLVTEECRTIISGTPIPTGHCSDGLNHGEGIDTTPEAPTPNRASYGGRYTILTGKPILEIKCSPTLTAQSGNGVMYCSVQYGVSVNSVLLTLDGITPNSTSQGVTYNVLIGQGVTGHLDVITDDNPGAGNDFLLRRLTWSIPGDTFAGYSIAPKVDSPSFNDSIGKVTPLDPLEIYKLNPHWYWRTEDSVNVSCTADVYAPVIPSTPLLPPMPLPAPKGHFNPGDAILLKLGQETQDAPLASAPDVPADYINIGSVTENRFIKIWAPYYGFSRNTPSQVFYDPDPDSPTFGSITTGTATNPAIRFFAKASTPYQLRLDTGASESSCGKITFVQLTRIDRRQYFGPNIRNAVTDTQGEFWLDGGWPFIEDGAKEVAASCDQGDVGDYAKDEILEAKDYPETKVLATSIHVYVDDQFSMYLVYLPPANNIFFSGGDVQWVPLHRLDWKWSTNVFISLDGTWHMGSSDAVSVVGEGRWRKHPEWNKTFKGK